VCVCVWARDVQNSP